MINFSAKVDRIKPVLFYVPVTGYFIVFATILALGLKQLANKNINADTAYADIYSLLIKVAVWFTITVTVLSLITVLVSYSYYLVRRRKGSIDCRVEVANRDDNSEKQLISIFIRPVLKPLLGFINLRLIYDGDKYSDKFLLTESSRRRFFNTAIEGTYRWPLPEIREYRVEKVVIYFEDILRFFSIAVTVPANNKFITHPKNIAIADIKVAPRKTEETTTRIDQLKKVEGEFLNYKNFENNDDVRRIVWKIYAKNKELVVRIPEIIDPYASHVYFYPSFFSKLAVEGSSVVEIPFLNYYKTCTWSIYRSVQERGFNVKYFSDQDSNTGSVADLENVKYGISTARWQHERTLRSFVKTSDASVVIVSSLSDPEEVQYLLNNYGRDITFIFIKLTDVLKGQNMLHLVQWLFIENDKNDLETYKRSWPFSPIRSKIVDNERLLEELMQKAESVVM